MSKPAPKGDDTSQCRKIQTPYFDYLYPGASLSSSLADHLQLVGHSLCRHPEGACEPEGVCESSNKSFEGLMQRILSFQYKFESNIEDFKPQDVDLDIAACGTWSLILCKKQLRGREHEGSRGEVHIPELPTYGQK